MCPRRLGLLVDKILALGVAQMIPRLGDLQANFSQCERYRLRAREQGLDVLVFPELNSTENPKPNGIGTRQRRAAHTQHIH